MSKDLEAALAEWAAGNYYEAHEHLEEVAEEYEENDPSYAIALALVRVAASFHKLKANVAPTAVPAKLDRALVVLDRAPAQWQGLDLATFVAATHAVRAQLDGVADGRSPPSLTYPVLR